MKLLNIFKSFKNDESGAVTVDWVVLTAALVGLGMAVVAAIAPAIGTTADAITADLNAANNVTLD
jgi:Flp pilus assembly pilin Flp